LKLKWTLVILLALHICSCEDDINYMGEFEIQYSLNCILRGDRTEHYATIKRSYAPDDQLSDKNVQNAVIRLILPDTTLYFEDSVSINNSFYVLKNYSLTMDTEIKIEADLPDSTLLSSATHTIYYSRLILDTENAIPLVIPDASFGDTYYYIWKTYGNSEDYIFGPSFYIMYYLTGNEEKIYYKEVVGKYDREINTYSVSIEFIGKSMEEISNGISNRESVNVFGAGFEVKVYDDALGIYANSIQTFEDEFSIRISEPDVSNIEGGFGIFGSYFSNFFNIELSTDYIESFGYTKAP